MQGEHADSAEHFLRLWQEFQKMLLDFQSDSNLLAELQLLPELVAATEARWGLPRSFKGFALRMFQEHLWLVPQPALHLLEGQ